MFKVIYTAAALKQLKKLDPFQSRAIYLWVKKNLAGTSNPRKHGKALSGDLSGYWRYRVGDYRLIAEILDGKLVIFIVQVGHRSKVYS